MDLSKFDPLPGERVNEFFLIDYKGINSEINQDLSCRYHLTLQVQAVSASSGVPVKLTAKNMYNPNQYRPIRRQRAMLLINVPFKGAVCQWVLQIGEIEQISRLNFELSAAYIRLQNKLYFPSSNMQPFSHSKFWYTLGTN